MRIMLKVYHERAIRATAEATHSTLVERFLSPMSPMSPMSPLSPLSPCSKNLPVKRTGISILRPHATPPLLPLYAYWTLLAGCCDGASSASNVERRMRYACRVPRWGSVIASRTPFLIQRRTVVSSTRNCLATSRTVSRSASSFTT